MCLLFGILVVVFGVFVWEESLGESIAVCGLNIVEVMIFNGYFLFNFSQHVSWCTALVHMQASPQMAHVIQPGVIGLISIFTKSWQRVGRWLTRCT